MKKRKNREDNRSSESEFFDTYSYLKLKEDLFECIKCNIGITKQEFSLKEGLCKDCFKDLN